MNELLQMFLRWVKDPFGKEEVLSKHNEVIHSMYETQALTRQATQKYDRQLRAQRIRRRQHILQGANSMERAVLGNRYLQRD